MVTMKKISIHVSQKYTYGSNIKKAVENLSIPTIMEPANIPANLSNIQKQILEKKIDELVKCKLTLKENIRYRYLIQPYQVQVTR